jgi:hypothetical protein
MFSPRKIQVMMAQWLHQILFNPPPLIPSPTPNEKSKVNPNTYVHVYTKLKEAADSRSCPIHAMYVYVHVQYTQS